jgi:hypothetical protein
MERRALVLALALTLPLALYGIPYAYALTTQSTYVVLFGDNIAAHGQIVDVVRCSSPTDSTQHFALFLFSPFTMTVIGSSLTNSAGGEASTGEIPNGWAVILHNPEASPQAVGVQIICQTPITVAGIGVPQFGSLYVAIALGAVVYFMMARRFAGRPTVSAQVKT